MTLRQVNITKLANLTYPDDMLNQPGVRKFWRLPLDNALFEFYDPIFEIYNPRKNGRDETFERKMRAAIEAERKLMAPLMDRLSGVEKYRTEQYRHATWSAMYRFYNKNLITWPDIGESLEWYFSKVIKVEGFLSSQSPETLSVLEKDLNDWQDCMNKLGELKKASAVEITGEKYMMKCEFNEPCGDACMALFMLLSERKNITRLKSVGFFLEKDLDRNYVPVGAAPKLT